MRYAISSDNLVGDFWQLIQLFLSRIRGTFFIFHFAVWLPIADGKELEIADGKSKTRQNEKYIQY